MALKTPGSITRIPPHDYIVNTYDGNNNLITTVYKMRGANGDIVAQIDMTYDGNNNLLTVIRTI